MSGSRRSVRLPADPEGFLEAVHSDWRTRPPRVHHLYGPLNVDIEMRGRGGAAAAHSGLGHT